jgi:hypothetical protein
MVYHNKLTCMPVYLPSFMVKMAWRSNRALAHSHYVLWHHAQCRWKFPCISQMGKEESFRPDYCPICKALLLQIQYLNIPEIHRLPFALQGNESAGEWFTVNFQGGVMAVYNAAANGGFGITQHRIPINDMRDQ